MINRENGPECESSKRDVMITFTASVGSTIVGRRRKKKKRLTRQCDGVRSGYHPKIKRVSETIDKNSSRNPFSCS